MKQTINPQITILLFCALLLLSGCTARDYYMNLASNTSFPDKRAPYIEKIKAIDAAAQAQKKGNKKTMLVYPVGLGSFLVSYNDLQ